MRALLLAAVFLLPALAWAQDAPRRVVLTDGTVVVGVVADEAADPIVVTTASGVEQRVPRARVARIEPLVGGRFTRVDPTRTRLVFSPTGRTMGQQGQTRLGVLSVVIPNVTYAVTPRVDLGAATFFTFGSGGVGGVLVPGAKAQVVSMPGLDAAVGASVAVPFSSGDDFDGSFAVTPYAAVSVGDVTRSATVGVTGFIGGSASQGDLTVGDGVLLSVGGEYQLTNGLKLLGEVLLPIGEGDTGVLVLPGIRFFGDRFSADIFGFVASGGGDTFGFAPLGSFTYTF